MCCVVSSEISRRVLTAIVESYLKETSATITSVDITQAPGDVVPVDIVRCS